MAEGRESAGGEGERGEEESEKRRDDAGGNAGGRLIAVSKNRHPS